MPSETFLPRFDSATLRPWAPAFSPRWAGAGRGSCCCCCCCCCCCLLHGYPPDLTQDRVLLTVCDIGRWILIPACPV